MDSRRSRFSRARLRRYSGVVNSVPFRLRQATAALKPRRRLIDSVRSLSNSFFRDASSETGAVGKDLTQKLIGPADGAMNGTCPFCCWHGPGRRVGLIKSLSDSGCGLSQSCRNVARAGIDVLSAKERTGCWLSIEILTSSSSSTP
jgi:hypothetical protein